MRDYVTDKTQEVINQSQSLNELSDKAKEEAVAIISGSLSIRTDELCKIKSESE